MNNFQAKLFVLSQELVRRDDAQDLVEYALALAMVVTISLTFSTGFSSMLSNMWTSLSTKIAGAA